ncbi:trypco2 family protein [Streptomyces sp. NPDC051642]|uniref:trypco2 family protein n=1 Tax=unclassified Streptomyces TaxID=2593676 RepID=UPI00344AC6D3
MDWYALKSGLWFELGPVELELALSVGKEGRAGGKVRFRFAELGTEAGRPAPPPSGSSWHWIPGRPAYRTADR